MTLKDRLKEVVKGSPLETPARQAYREARRMARYGRDAVGAAALRAGRQPPATGSSWLALQQWLDFLRSQPAPEGERILLFAVRNKTWVKWMVYAAAWCYRLGRRPVLVYSGREMDRLYDVTGARAVAARLGYSFWHAVRHAGLFELIDLDTYEDSGAGGEYAEFATRMADSIAAYDLGVEEYEPGPLADEYERARAAAEQMLRATGAAAERLLREAGATRLVCPNGQVGRSVALLEAARRANVTALCVEAWCARPGHMVWNVDQPALEYDVEGWLEVVGAWDELKEEENRQFREFQEQAHLAQTGGWLQQYRPPQRAARSEGLSPALAAFFEREGPKFFLGPNVVGDSATLGRATLFRSQVEWVQEVVKFFRAHPDLNLVVRAHPYEGILNAVIRLGDVATEEAGEAPNIHVVHGREDVNSYALMARADVGLMWVSNVGLDMALRGQPVVLAARAAYSGLGLCREPENRAAYFGEILLQAQRPTPPSPEALERGKRYQHFLTRLLSLKVYEPGYNAADLRLGPAFDHPERTRFFRILAGDLDSKGRP